MTLTGFDCLRDGVVLFRTVVVEFSDPAASFSKCIQCLRSSRIDRQRSMNPKNILVRNDEKHNAD